MNKKYARYRMNVLSYYRCEWTDIRDEDTEYRIAITSELDKLIRSDYDSGINIPNSSMNVKIFMGMLNESF
jgi:hypothetical protein